MRTLLISVMMVSMTLSAQNAGRGAAPAAMILTIPGFPDGGQIPVKFSQAAPGVAAGDRAGIGKQLVLHADFEPGWGAQRDGHAALQAREIQLRPLDCASHAGPGQGALEGGHGASG